MNTRYPHLFSPFRLGNRILKSHLITTPSGMHMNRASEPFVTDTLITYYENKARNGAAMIQVNGGVMDYDPNNTDSFHANHDVMDPRNRRALAQLVDSIHLYGALANVNLHLGLPEGYDVSGDIQDARMLPPAPPGTVYKEIPEEMMLEFADKFTDTLAALRQDCGYDGCFLHLAYRMMPLGRFISPLTNHRTDAYGGSLENNLRYPRYVMEQIKKKCGQDFIIEISMSGYDPEECPGGLTKADVATYLKMLKGLVDLVQIKAPWLDPAHPIQFHSKHPWIDLEAEIRELSGRAIPILGVGGLGNPDDAERVLAEDKVDLVGVCRAWISNPEYGRLVYENRTDDIVPCLRCNKCHRPGLFDPLIPGCSVNPAYGIEHKMHRIVKPLGRSKKLAVVGGGPAGMRTAMYLRDRGHSVTLFERNDRLGGQLNCTTHVDFKWTLQDYKNWLIYQVGKKDVDVRLNTPATKELLRAGGYEEIFICVGADPTLPNLPGADGANVSFGIDAFEHYGHLGQRIVIIGGGEVGMELAIFLGRMGKEVTVLSRNKRLAKDSAPLHFYNMFREEWEKLPNVTPIPGAAAVAIDAEGVTYELDGQREKARCDNVLLTVGMTARREEAMSLFVEGVRCHLVGDCDTPGNLLRLNRCALGETSYI